MQKKSKLKNSPPGGGALPEKKHRVLILTFVLMGVVGYAFGKHPDLFFGPSQQTFPKASLDLAPGVVAVPPLEMEATLAASYRLKPDNRFLLAVDKVTQFVTGKTGQVDARFESKSWIIFHSGEAVGKLPEIPNFPDFLKFLKNWAQLLSERHPSFLKEGNAIGPEFKVKTKQALESFQPKSISHYLKELDSHLKSGTRRLDLLVPAAKAFSILAFNMLDTMEVADDVPAQSLAVLAVAQAFTEEPLVKEEARLAESMGYSTHAQKRARKLNVSDPLRQYILKNTPALKALAVKQSSDWETRYLYLLRLAKSRDNSTWEQWYDEGFPFEYEDTLALFKTGLVLDSFSDNNYYARNVRQLIIEYLKLEVEGPPTSNPVSDFFGEILPLSETAQLFNSFQEMTDDALDLEELESELSGLDELYTGPFLDSKTYQSFFRGLFFSSLYIDGRQYLDRFSSIETAEQFLLDTGTTSGKGSDDSQYGSDFHRWFSFLIQVSRRDVKPNQVMAVLEEMPGFKGEPIYKIYDETQGLIPSGSPVKFRALKHVVARLDTRLSHRDHLRLIALNDLYDPGLSEKMGRSINEFGGNHFPFQQNWLYKFTGNSRALLKKVQTGEGETKTRIWILGFLETLKKLDNKTLIREYRKLVKEDPDDWYVRKPFIEFLIRKKRFTEARKQAQNWLERDVDVPGLEKTAAHNFVAETLYEQKKYSKAYEEILKVVRGYQGKSLRLAAQILDKLGEEEKAEQVFKKAIKRYPNHYKQTQGLVNFYWGRGRYEEARDLVMNFPGGLSVGNWRSDMALGFYFTFKDKPEKEAIAAFDVMLDSGFNHFDLAHIPGSLHKGDRSRLAFKLQTKLRGQKSPQLGLEVKAYDFLKVWKGKQAATKWFKAQKPERFGIHSANVFFEKKKFSLLWDLIPGSQEPQVWLLRAAASLRSKTTARQRQQLQKYFGKNDPASTRNQIGRYLLGKISEEDLLRQADDPVKRLEIAFYIGWKARAQGDWYKAARWFRIAVETGEKKHWEYGWAGNHLFNWKERGFALSYLKRHPELL